MIIDKIPTTGKDIILFLAFKNEFTAITFVGDKCYPNALAVSPRKAEDDDDPDDDDDFYNEEEDKENPFDREPTEKDIVDEDFPLGTPEDDLIDDDEEILYN